MAGLFWVWPGRNLGSIATWRPGTSTWVKYLLGTNVNTPLCQCHTPQFEHGEGARVETLNVCGRYYTTIQRVALSVPASLGKHFAAVVIRSLELYDQGKRAFWFHLRLRRLRSSENQIVGVATENVHCNWFILPLLLPTPTIWFSPDHERQSHKRSRKKMETFWLASDSDSVALITLLTTPIFDLQWVKRSYTTPLTPRTPTPSLVKTSLYASRV